MLRDRCLIVAHLKFVGVMALVAAALIAFHIFIESKWFFSQSVRAFYAVNQGGKPKGQLWPLFDIVLPAVASILATAVLFRGKRFLHTAMATALFNAMIVALLPVYALVLSPAPLWWWPKGGAQESLDFLVRMFVKCFLFFSIGTGFVWLCGHGNGDITDIARSKRNWWK